MFQQAVKTPVGTLTLCANTQGLTRVMWGVMRGELAGVEIPNTHTQAAAQQLQYYFHKKLQTPDIKYEIAGTEFQKKVWRAVAAIPYGTVLSYKELAAAAGVNPRACRAVGSAVGANPLTILIPCHRVIGSNGALGGYSGGQGLPTKLNLLRHEGVHL